MNVLTDSEIDAVWPAPPGTNSMLAYARAVEAATIRKLAAGVSAEPAVKAEFSCCGNYTTGAVHFDHVETLCCGNYDLTSPDMYTLDQLTTATAAARAQENERCLALMDSIGCDWRDGGEMAKFYATNYLREAIRALLGKEAT